MFREKKMGRRKDYNPDIKYCPICKQYKNRKTEFYQYKNRPSGGKYCIECERLDSRSKHLNISLLELKYLLQVTHCEICGMELKDDYSKKIDHDHETGQVRGVLCTRCNTGLGKFLDSPELLDKASSYLLERK